MHRIRRSKERGIDRFRSHYNNAEILAASRKLFRALRPAVVHVFHLYRLSTAVVEAAQESGAKVVFTATDFWTICPTSLLRRHDNSMCGGPNWGQGNCLKCLANHAPPAARRVLQRLPGWVLSGAAALSWAPLTSLANKVRLLRTFLRRRGHMRNMLQSCDAIIAPTEIMRDMLTGNGVSPEKIVRLGYGLNPSYTDTYRTKRPSPEVRFGYIGQIAEHKGVHVLLQAFRLLRETALPRPVSLRVWGDPAQQAGYTAWLRDLAAGQPGVEFRGTFPNRQIGEIFTDIDALIVPSLWYENAPLVILSAFATGTPVIATDVPGTAELIDHARNGLLFPRGDARGLAEQLRRVASEEGLLGRLRAGIPRVKTMTEQAAELECLYDRLLAGRAVSPPDDEGPGGLTTRTSGAISIGEEAI
ncbi:hypothetical protein AYO44_12435 [Planctomycetaceae bacterium SCGC AG-212-F19]|nr:hypothetical protein AYO44_12435 [Planctomycetaceae bacterium SCGC AG-212-F19]